MHKLASVLLLVVSPALLVLVVVSATYLFSVLIDASGFLG
jgi:hypothetical protein